jgi:3-hydroxypropanoate dehydrogenase
MESPTIDLLFREARTFSKFTDRTVDESTLVEMVNLAKLAPTGANGQPLRVVFVRSAEAKARLIACAQPGNVDKIKSAPVTAIVAYDLDFASKMPKLFPQAPQMATTMASLPEAARDAWLAQNGSLQGGYLMIAARLLGLDCGPMGGFDKDKVNAAFFAASQWRANFLLNLGYGDRSALHPRNPRLSFEEMCTFA